MHSSLRDSFVFWMEHLETLSYWSQFEYGFAINSEAFITE